MSRLLLLLALATTLAAETVSLAGIELTIPEGLVAEADPPVGALASWRSADGVAAMAVVERSAADAEDFATQVAALQALGQGVVIAARGEHPPGSGWQRLRYQLELGPTRFTQDARLALLPGIDGPRQVVVTASWPHDAAARWDAVLTAALDALPPVARASNQEL